MSALANNANPNTQSELATRPVIVVGTGPVGIRFVQELHKRKPEQRVLVFGDEPWLPYNRVKLSSLLSGDATLEELQAGTTLPDAEQIETQYNNRVEQIDPLNKTVTDSQGVTHLYSELVLATGSRARIPQLPGNTLKNVFSFRHLNDAQSLMSRSARTRKTIIVGGGLLGLEAARAMQRYNTEVTVLEHSQRLMFFQLDGSAGEKLREHITELGIQVETDVRVTALNGQDGSLHSVSLADGRELPCDTLIFAAGIIPNIDLARTAGLSFDRGIRIDDHLQTNQPDVYAIGECAEHQGKVYGLVAPGFEQAAVLADRLAGGEAQYRGSMLATSLKVVGMPVFSAGSIGDDESLLKKISFEDPETGDYRKLVLRRGRLIGALSTGDWAARSRLQEAINRGRRLWPWQLERFRAEGSPWGDENQGDVATWPADAVVCNCVGVTRGQLSAACSGGACSVAQLSAATGASSVCGSCQPLLQELCGAAERAPIKSRKPLLIGSTLAALLALLVTLLPGNTWNSSVQSFQWDALWRDNLFKQISGYSLLGLSVLISFISLRKRVRRFSWGQFLHWRLFHVLTGVLLVAVLVTHTGFRFGANLNLWLMLAFSALLITGALSGLILADEHKLSPANARLARRTAIWTHIALLWPLPALLGFHILKSYYF